jgi:hypothetical protein
MVVALYIAILLYVQELKLLEGKKIVVQNAHLPWIRKDSSFKHLAFLKPRLYLRGGGGSSGDESGL